MAFERARKVTAVPATTQSNTIYVVATNDPKVKRIVVTDAANVKEDLGLKSGYMVNKKLFAAA